MGDAPRIRAGVHREHRRVRQIWRVPFRTTTNGGATFLVVSPVAIVVIGIPALLAEFVIGRRANRNAIDAPSYQR